MRRRLSARNSARSAWVRAPAGRSALRETDFCLNVPETPVFSNGFLVVNV